MGLNFRGDISLGNIITIVTMVAGLATGYATLNAGLTMAQEDIKQLETDRVADISRIRSVELAQAGQDATLDSIQAGISEIKAALSRLENRSDAR